MGGYVALTWDADSLLSPREREIVEQQRRDLWRGGIREPNLTRMAFEFGAVACMLQTTDGDGPEKASSSTDRG